MIGPGDTVWLVSAYTLDGHPYGSTRVPGTRDDAARVAARYMENPKIGRVRCVELLPEPTGRGNGRYR